MPNLSAVNAVAVNASAGAEVFKLSVDLRQVVTWRLHVDLRQVVGDPAPYTVAMDMRQVVYEITRVGVDLRRVVGLPTYRVGVDMRQAVGGVYRIGMDLRQLISDGLAVSGPSTQRIQVTVLLGGVDVSAAVTGTIQIDREEGAAAVAEFTLLPAAGPIDLAHWVGASVIIDVSSNGSPPERVFTGQVSDPLYDAVARTTTFACTDGMQSILDSLQSKLIDQIAGGYWSDALFSSDASGSERARDRMSTIPESLDMSPFGAFRRTPWVAKATADYTFTADSIVDQSLRVEPGPWRELTNRIELIVELRYTRHRHRERAYHWVYEPTFHNWIVDHTSLPTQDMIRRAAEEQSWRLTYEHFVGMPVTVNPATGKVESQVINGVVWTNDGKTNQYVLEARLSAYARWDESITETYNIIVEAPASVARFGIIRQYDYISMAAEDDGLNWIAEPARTVGPLGGESSDGLSGSGIGVRFPDLEDAKTAPNKDRYIDTLDQTYADNVIVTALARASTTILSAHRANTVEIIAALLPRLDLIHTVSVDTEPVAARGKVRQIVHRIDSAGEATTTVRIAVSQASDAEVVADPVEPLPRIDTLAASQAALNPGLGASHTHLGRRWYSYEERDDWTGYVGNYDIPEPVTAKAYTERFVIDWKDIDRDPVAVSRVVPHIVAVPHEQLEIAA